jgi:hypothetical protein
MIPYADKKWTCRHAWRQFHRARRLVAKMPPHNDNFLAVSRTQAIYRQVFRAAKREMPKRIEWNASPGCNLCLIKNAAFEKLHRKKWVGAI